MRVAGTDVAEIVRHDDPVERLAVDPRRLQRFLCSIGGQIGGDQLVRRVAALANPGDRLELSNDVRVRLVERLLIRAAEVVLEKVVVGDDALGDVTAAADDDRVNHFRFLPLNPPFFTSL